MDRGAWKAANPALSSFRSFVELEQSAEKAARMPSFENSFRNLYLNQRVNMVSAFVSPAVWKSGNVPIDDEAFLAGPIYGGLDLSATTDLTALVMTARDHEGVLHVRPYFWMPQDSVLEASKRSEEHTSELQSLMRISYAVFCLKKKKHRNRI